MNVSRILLCFTFEWFARVGLHPRPQLKSSQKPYFKILFRLLKHLLVIVGDGEGEGGPRDGGATDVLCVLQPLHAHAPPGRRSQAL